MAIKPRMKRFLLQLRSFCFSYIDAKGVLKIPLQCRKALQFGLLGGERFFVSEANRRRPPPFAGTLFDQLWNEYVEISKALFTITEMLLQC